MLKKNETNFKAKLEKYLDLDYIVEWPNNHFING